MADASPVEDAATDGPGLGRLLGRFGSCQSAVMWMVAAIALGLGSGAVAANGEALATALALDRSDGPAFAVAGRVLLGLATALMFWGVVGVRRSFEVWQRGARMVRPFSVAELSWDELKHVRVRRAAAVARNNLVSRWDVELVGRERAIRLRPGFLRGVRDVPALVGLIETASGRTVELPPAANQPIG